MGNQQAKPAFGQRKRSNDYYLATRAYIDSLRGTTTLRDIASMMNGMGWTSPAGRPWVKQTVANFVRSKNI